MGGVNARVYQEFIRGELMRRSQFNFEISNTQKKYYQAAARALGYPLSTFIKMAVQEYIRHLSVQEQELISIEFKSYDTPGTSTTKKADLESG